MEGVGSRLGRASSRYGPTATTTVFNGPVRKWEKRWVHVAPSSPSIAATTHHSAQSDGHNNAVSPLLLRRWTPLSPADGEFAIAGGYAGAPAEEPPRRKFRYTPIVVLEEQKKVSEKKAEAEEKSGEAGQSPARLEASASSEAERKPIMADEDDKEEDLEKETEATEKFGSPGSNSSHLDLGLGLKGPEDVNGANTTSGTEEEIQKEKTGGFWSTGIET